MEFQGLARPDPWTVIGAFRGHQQTSSPGKGVGRTLSRQMRTLHMASSLPNAFRVLPGRPLILTRYHTGEVSRILPVQRLQIRRTDVVIGTEWQAADLTDVPRAHPISSRQDFLTSSCHGRAELLLQHISNRHI